MYPAAASGRARLAGCAAALAVLVAAGAAPAEELRLLPYAEDVRFDLLTLKMLEAGRPDGPQDSEAFLLPTPVQLRAVRDEVVAFQVVVRGEPGPRPINVRTTTTASAAAPLATVFQARGIEIKDPSKTDFVISLGAGLYPGPLVPTRTATLSAEGHAVLWVDLYVPKDLAPGKYAGELKVAQASLPFELEVLPLVMPARDAARLGAVNFGSLLFRGNEDLRVERRWMQLAHAHGLSVELMRPVPKVRDDGTIDWEGWAARVGPYIDGSAFTAEAGYVGPRAGRPTTRFVVPLTDWWPVKATQDHLPSDPAKWSATLAAWERFVEQKGWFDRPEATTWILFINSLDEPHDAATLESLIKYGPLIDAAHLARRDHLLFRVDGNFGQNIEGWDDGRMADALGPVTDLWNVHGAPWTIPWGLLMKLRREDGDRVMAYASNTSGEPSIPPLAIDTPLVGARAWGWIVARYELEGLLNWEVDHWTEACRGNPRCSPGGELNLEANLIFRAEEYGGKVGDAYPSYRLKALRRGSQDVALLSIYAQHAPDTAALIAAAVVPNALGDQVPPKGPGAWSMDPETYHAAREAVLDRLMEAEHPFPLEKIRHDPVPAWVWHFDRWLVVLFMAIAGFSALVYIIKK